MNEKQRRQSLPNSRLYKVDNEKLFQDQRSAAKAWRDKNLLNSSVNNIFSPPKLNSNDDDGSNQKQAQHCIQSSNKRKLNLESLQQVTSSVNNAIDFLNSEGLISTEKKARKDSRLSLPAVKMGPFSPSKVTTGRNDFAFCDKTSIDTPLVAKTILHLAQHQADNQSSSVIPIQSPIRNVSTVSPKPVKLAPFSAFSPTSSSSKAVPQTAAQTDSSSMRSSKQTAFHQYLQSQRHHSLSKEVKSPAFERILKPIIKVEDSDAVATHQPADMTCDNHEHTTWTSRASQITGFVQLTVYERYFLLAVMMFSPLLLYQLDCLFASCITIVPSTCNALSHYMQALQPSDHLSEFLTTAWNDIHELFLQWHERILHLSVEQLAAIVTLSVVINVACDYNTSVLDEHFASCINYFVRPINTDDVVAKKSQDKSNDEAIHNANHTTGSVRYVRQVIINILPDWLQQRVQLLSAFTLSILAFTWILRCIVTNMFVIVVDTVQPHANTIYSVLSLLAALFALYLYISHRIQQSRIKRMLVPQLGDLTKKILVSLHNSKPYPIEYLYEEVSDILRSHKYRSSVVATSSTPAVVHSGNNFLGNASSSSLSPAATSKKQPQQQSTSTLKKMYNMIFSPSKEHNISDGDRNEDNAAKEHAMVISEINSMVKEVDMQGFSLRSVWKDVQKYVERDTRIQTIDMVVDGGSKTCWRVLSGNTSIVTSFFSR